MKLSLKIFLGVCIPSILALVIISKLLIDTSFKNDIDNETMRCMQEYRLIEKNISDSNNNDNTKVVVDAYSDYYKDKGIYFLYFKDDQEICSSNNEINLNNKKLLEVENDSVLTQIKNVKNMNYLLISTRLSDDEVLIYARDISSIYNVKNKLTNISIILILGIFALISVIAYIISKRLTKPLSKMQKEMQKLSKGDYNIKLKEGNSEFGRLAHSFNQMSKELEERDRELLDLIDSKQTFIDNLSHEINTPLTSILGYAELLEKANCTEEQKNRFLINIENETKRIRDIHKNLLLLSYKEKADFEMKNIDSEYIFENVFQNLYFKLKEHNINLIIQNKISNFYGDSTLIIMSISNLILNAINASKDGSQIILRGYETVDRTIVEVEDEGFGISKENIEKILEPFYRVDKARSRKNGGAGLGLSICKRIMNLHEGEIKIESELGKGSIFILEFPKKK